MNILLSPEPKKRLKVRTLFCLSLLLCVFQSVWAEDEIITIEGAKIRGNQELPTILYLVPWQNPEIQGIEAPSRNFAVQRSLKPLERTEFQRLIGYHEQFMSAPKRAASESQ